MSDVRKLLESALAAIKITDDDERNFALDARDSFNAQANLNECLTEKLAQVRETITAALASLDGWVPCSDHEAERKKVEMLAEMLSKDAARFDSINDSLLCGKARTGTDRMVLAGYVRECRDETRAALAELEGGNG